MEVSSTRIDFTPPAERANRTAVIDGHVFHEGRLFASQDWAKKGDIKKATNYVRGVADTYGPNQKPLVYKFATEDGKECYLVGDAHHRIGIGLAEGVPITAEIDADLGMISKELLNDPGMAARKFGVLGIDGIWPYQVFMKKLIEARTQLEAMGK